MYQYFAVAITLADIVVKIPLAAISFKFGVSNT